jgi:hypothetical protein
MFIELNEQASKLYRNITKHVCRNYNVTKALGGTATVMLDKLLEMSIKDEYEIEYWVAKSTDSASYDIREKSKRACWQRYRYEISEWEKEFPNELPNFEKPEKVVIKFTDEIDLLNKLNANPY